MAGPEQFPVQPPEERKTFYTKAPESSEDYQKDRNIEKTVGKDFQTLSYFGSESLDEIEELNERARPLEERLAKYPPALRESQREWETRRSLSKEEAAVEIKRWRGGPVFSIALMRRLSRLELKKPWTY